MNRLMTIYTQALLDRAFLTAFKMSAADRLLLNKKTQGGVRPNEQKNHGSPHVHTILPIHLVETASWR
jgi:hypothetical protein